MSVAVYARMTKLTNVAGRVDYISSDARQENLLAVAGMTDQEYWRQLAADSQAAWRQAGGHKEGDACCEAREMHGDLPMSALNEDLDQLAAEMAEDFKARTGADNIVAIHLNRTKTNLHYHRIFSERQRLPEPEIRYADRNAFLDENGVRKRTKKEILDADGQLRPGCRIVPKGEALSVRHFGDKESIFSEKGWLDDYKAAEAEWINRRLQPDQQRVVFDRSGPYLAQIHIGKGRPAEQERKIREYNREVKAFNKLVREGVISLQEAERAKSAIMLAPDRLAALGAVLAGLTDKRAHDALSQTALWHLDDKNLDRLEVHAGAKRTNTGPDESRKRALREAYRLAAVERQAARTATNDLDRRIHATKAREYSAEIDRLRKELGYYQAEDYRRAVEKKERELRRKRDWALRCRNRANSLLHSAYRTEDYIKYLKKQLYSMPLFFLTEQEKKREQELRLQIAQAEERAEELRWEAYRANQAYKEAKKEAKQLRKENRQAKRERRQAERQRQAPEKPTIPGRHG